MDEDKDDWNDNKMVAMFTMTRNERAHGIPAAQATPCMRSVNGVSVSRQYVKDCPETPEADADEPYA